MSKKLLILFLFFPLAVLLSWGDDGHLIIARYTLQNLPVEIEYFKQWENYIVKHSIDADIRKFKALTEKPEHYIDIDFYPEFNTGKMITDKNKLIEKYGDSTVTAHGLLPWITLENYNNLVTALKEKNRDKVLIFAADLSHYVADGHQPMHTTLNFDGQLTGQIGIHSRFEVDLVNLHEDEIISSLYSGSGGYVVAALPFIFNYITESNSYLPLIFAADNYAFEYAGSRVTDDYNKLFWFKTKYLITNRMSAASKALASLYYSAWVDAGKPNLKEIN
ncbi:MAG: zinc dependent phospholipase C family protein [Ignavibacteriaceae bacterium]|nr:zinc dependent phospholipase C family protein [Ignavibacteriaceae bacterium]